MLANPANINWIISLPNDSPLANEIDTNSLPKLPDGSYMLGSLGIMRESEVGYMVHPAGWKRCRPRSDQGSAAGLFQDISKGVGGYGDDR